MRTCKDIEPLIFSFVSGDILSSQKRILDEHIKECEPCLNEMMKLQRLDLNLAELKEEESSGPPEELKSAILKEMPSYVKKKGSGIHKLFSPTAVLAVATTCLAIFVFILVGKVEQIAVNSSQPKTKSVKILFFSKDAQKVSLVGDFNGWGAEPLMLRSGNNGMWEAELKLPPGMYQYNLVVDNDMWVANPNSNAQVPDGFGGTNSVVIVNGKEGNQIETIGERI